MILITPDVFKEFFRPCILDGSWEQTSYQFDQLRRLLDAHSIVAGGAVRDIIRGDQPKDIDVFSSTEGLEAATTAAADLDEELFTSTVDDFAQQLGGGSASASGVRGVFTIGSVQVIHVGSPIKRVSVFDAVCNMVWVDHKGAAWAHSRQALEHIRDGVWEPNPNTVMTQSEYSARRAKFEARGWAVPDHWEPRSSLHTNIKDF